MANLDCTPEVHIDSYVLEIRDESGPIRIVRGDRASNTTVASYPDGRTEYLGPFIAPPKGE